MATIIIPIATLVVLIGGLVILGRLLRSGKNKEDDKSMIMLQNQINELNRTLDNKLGESAKVMRDQVSESNKIIREIVEELTKVGEGQKQVMNVTDQLKNLQDILKNPKQRGVLGEYYLGTVLENVLPPGVYQTQYEFKDGTKVDAVIFLKDKIIPIDSKFSLENYNRLLEAQDSNERKRLEEQFRNDLKGRIEETAKYIKPEEGTTEFAFMFIPSEAIYYDLLVNKVGAVKANTRDLIEYAVNEKKVIIVSPTSFLAYLQTVIQGLRSLQIEESAKEIKKRVGDLGRHLENYKTYMEKLGTHLGTTVNMYHGASKEFQKIDKDVIKIGGNAIGIEAPTIEKPRQFDEDD